MTDLPTTEKLDLELTDGWLTIWFNSPANRNALSAELANELTATLRAIHDDRSVRGVTLRGRGGVFCAGGDLKAFEAAFAGDKADRREVVRLNEQGGEIFRLVNELPQVTVALVEGAAIAGGLGLICCADIVAVTREAKFALTETQLGIIPAQIAPHVLRRLGEPLTRRLMLTGARFKGGDAAAYGLADFVVDDVAELDTIDKAIQADVMRCAPGANAATKELLRACAQGDRTEFSKYAAAKFAECLLSPEGREGVSAFVQKRPPSWSLSSETRENAK